MSTCGARTDNDTPPWQGESGHGEERADAVSDCLEKDNAPAVGGPFSTAAETTASPCHTATSKGPW